MKKYIYILLVCFAFNLHGQGSMQAHDTDLLITEGSDFSVITVLTEIPVDVAVGDEIKVITSDFNFFLNAVETSTQYVAPTLETFKAYPNPFFQSVRMKLETPEKQDMRFIIISSTGQKLQDYYEESISGFYEKTFNLDALPSGTYFLIAFNNQQQVLGRIQLVKVI